MGCYAFLDIDRPALEDEHGRARFEREVWDGMGDVRVEGEIQDGSKSFLGL